MWILVFALAIADDVAFRPSPVLTRAWPAGDLTDLPKHAFCAVSGRIEPDGSPEVTGPEATRECPAAFGAAVAAAVRDGWTWPADLAGQSRHVSIGWVRPADPVPDRATWPSEPLAKPPKRVAGERPPWPQGVGPRNPTPCTVHTLVDALGRPFFSASDSCPAPFQRAAVRAILRWRVEPGAGVRLIETKVQFRIR